jgi:hypothetical protein
MGQREMKLCYRCNKRPRYLKRSYCLECFKEHYGHRAPQPGNKGLHKLADWNRPKDRETV